MNRRAIDRLDRQRPAQFQRPMRQIHVVTAEIGQSPSSKRPPVAPSERQIFRAIRPVINGPQPQIVMKVRRHGWSFPRQIHAPVSRGDPHVHLAHRPDRLALHQFNHATIIGAGVDLRADLRHALVLLRGLGDDPRFRNGPGQRFFAIDVAPAAQGRHGGHGMGVIGRTDHHGVNVLLVEQAAEVIVSFCLGIFLFRRGQELIVDVAKGDDVFAADLLEVLAGPVGDAHHANIQLLIRREASGMDTAAQADQPRARGRGGGLFDEMAAMDGMFHNDGSV